MKTNTGVSPLLRKDGPMAVSDADKADVLNTVLNTFCWCIYKRKCFEYT